MPPPTPPRWRLPYQLAGTCSVIAPARDMLRLPEPEFRIRYEQRLDAIGPEEIARQLQAIAGPDDDRVVLLCFEDLAKGWCHRTLFGAWWTRTTGQQVTELQDEESFGK